MKKKKILKIHLNYNIITAELETKLQLVVEPFLYTKKSLRPMVRNVDSPRWPSRGLQLTFAFRLQFMKAGAQGNACHVSTMASF